jgi:hypothetical protein
MKKWANQEKKVDNRIGKGRGITFADLMRQCER